jgi:hypothetical protein
MMFFWVLVLRRKLLHGDKARNNIATNNLTAVTTINL